jgi:hypothetical protein
MLEHSFRSIPAKLTAVCPVSEADGRRRMLRAATVLSVIIPFATLLSNPGVAEPLDYLPHFKTVFIDGNPNSDEVVLVTMRANGNDPRRTIKQLVSRDITVDGTFFAQMSKGYIVDIDIGHSTVAGEYGLNVIDARLSMGEVAPGTVPEPTERGPFSYPVNTADLPSGIRDGIIDACTTPGQASFDFPIAMQVKAYRFKRGNTSVNKRRDNTVFGKMPIRVICQQESQSEAPPKPVSVDIRVAQKGNTCPKDAEVTAYIDYEKPMTGRFQVVHNGVPGKTIEIKAREVSLAGKTWYRIERLQRYELDPGKHDFQIKVVGGGESPTRRLDVDCPPFKVTSAWLKYEVEDKDTCPKKVVEEATFHANGPGEAPYRIKTQGGLVVTQGTAHIAREGDKYFARRTRTLSMGAFDQMMQLELVNDPSAGDQKPLKVECVEALSGELTLQSRGANSCKGEALVAIHTGGAGELPYELECGPGKSWQRKVTAMANKIGVDKVAFDVTNNEQVTCALRTRIGGKLKPLDGASMTFTCHKPIDTGADDLVPETRPDAQKPDGPGKIVIDPPRDSGGSKPEPTIACAGGTVKGGACVCERTMKPVKAGKNAWRCVKVAVDPKPDKPTVSQPKISCAGGTVRNGGCVCGRGEKPVKAGKDAWRCVKIAVIDPPRIKDSGNRSDARVKGNNKSVKIGNTKADVSNRSSSSMPR